MPVPSGDNGGGDQIYIDAAQGAVVEILINETLDPDANPKEIVFLDLDPASFGVKSRAEMLVKLNASGYQDPWGGSYGILMDLDFDEKITGTAYGDLRMKVAVYSGGEEKDILNPPHKTW